MEELLQNLGRRIRDLRSQRGWSQEKFSEICAVHRTWMGQIERGRNISIRTLANIAQALEVPLAELFVGIDAVAEAVPRPVRVPKTGQQTVVALLEELRAERAILREAVETLRKVALGKKPMQKKAITKKARQNRGRV